MKTTRARLRLEVLEDRCTPATFGNPWPDAQHLTLSFAPNGTQIGSQTNVLFQQLNTQAPTAVWEQTILRAFQTWAVNAQINIGLVSDDGLPFGTQGLVQGDGRFGDIRIGAYPMAADVVAISTPFEMDGGTWSGDVTLNSNMNFGLNGTGTYDLFTVAMHEAGHVFGLNDNTNPASVMYQSYTGARTGLDPSDVSALLNLYSPPTVAANTQMATATAIFPSLGANGSLTTAVDGNLSSLTATRYYKVSGLSLGDIQVQLQTSGYSFLESRLTVYNGFGWEIGTVAATNPVAGDLTVTVPNLLGLGTYYVEVQGNSSTVFGMGGYHLQVQTLPLLSLVTTTAVGTLQNVTTSLLNDLPLNTTPLTALLLPQQYSQVDGHFDYAYRARIGYSGETEFFKLTAPTLPAGQPDVLEAMVWGLDYGGLLPTLTVLDSNQHVVPATILVNDSGMVVVQIANAVPGASYFVEVAAQNPSGPQNIGNYFMGVTFTTVPVNLQTFATGTVNQTTPQLANNVTVSQSGLFHFVLSAATANPSDAAGVRMTIYDNNGNVVFTLVALNQQTMSGNVYLPAGNYVVRFAGGTPNGSALMNLVYTVKGLPISDPIGPSDADTTSDPSGTSTSSSPSSPGPNPSTTSTTGPSDSDPSTDPDDQDDWSSDYTYDSGSPDSSPSSGVQPEDPYSDPYSSA